MNFVWASMDHCLDAYADDLFPCVVVGFELHGIAARHLRKMPDLPKWFALIEGHQTGGYACSHHSVAGVVLRLADNGAFVRDLPRLLKGLDSMAGGCSTSEMEKKLRNLVFTGGGPYTKLELLALTEFLAECGKFPPLVSGIEALVQMEDKDPLHYFNGWQMHSPVIEKLSPLEQCFSADHWEQTEVIGDLLNAELDEINRWEIGGFDAAMSGVFLTWMNSD